MFLQLLGEKKWAPLKFAKPKKKKKKSNYFNTDLKKNNKNNSSLYISALFKTALDGNNNIISFFF